MKKKNLNIFRIAVCAVILFAVSIIANAQKLPNVQKDGVYAPANVKTDGKAVEWDDSFQAYNKSTNLYYTIANNADKLYLTMQATDPNDINKIMAGGITFTIKSTDKKSAASPVSISYPIKTRIARPALGGPGNVTVIGGGPGGGGGMQVSRIVVGGQFGGANRPISSMAKLRGNEPLTDSDIMVLNKQATLNVNEIKIIGVKEFPDSTVSIYNDQGVNAAGAFSFKKAYTIEFAIDLKYLQPVINNAGTFNYNIQVNGLVMNIVQLASPPGGGEAVRVMDVAVVGGGGGGGGGGGSSFQSMTSPTDFSGTYTLAKK